MNNWIISALLIFGALVPLFVWLIWRENDRIAKIRVLWVAEQQTRNKAKCEAIEADLRGWLKALELPTLADQTRLEAAARQLRIVLVERLVNGPRV